jgi:hypothetical protein
VTAGPPGDAALAPAQAQQPKDSFPLGHAQLVHGDAFAPRGVPGLNSGHWYTLKVATPGIFQVARPGTFWVAAEEWIWELPLLGSHEQSRGYTISAFMFRFVQHVVCCQKRAFGHPHGSTVSSDGSGYTDTRSNPASAFWISLIREAGEPLEGTRNRVTACAEPLTTGVCAK